MALDKMKRQQVDKTQTVLKSNAESEKEKNKKDSNI